MKPLHDSTADRNNPEQLRESAARDGYLLLRNLLPAADVIEIGQELAHTMAESGWITPDEPLETATADISKFCVEPQPAFMEVFHKQLSLKSMHALRSHPAIIELFDELFEEPTFAVPHFVTRLAFPQHEDYATPAHQDHVHFEGSKRNWAAWIPFTTVDEQRGGLAIAAGSHHDGAYDMRPALGAGQMIIDADLSEMDWRWSPMGPGDVLIHNCLTVHRGLPNSTTSMRVSVDYRYQPLSEPVGAKFLGVSHQMKTWDELYEGWDGNEFKHYWADLDLDIEPFEYRWYDRRDELAIAMGERADPEALLALENITLKHRDESVRERAKAALQILQSNA